MYAIKVNQYITNPSEEIKKEIVEKFSDFIFENWNHFVIVESDNQNNETEFTLKLDERKSENEYEYE